VRAVSTTRFHHAVELQQEPQHHQHTATSVYMPVVLFGIHANAECNSMKQTAVSWDGEPGFNDSMAVLTGAAS
jgi:hypothetical protein